MNGRKSKEIRKKADRLKLFMSECYEMELNEWRKSEPSKIRFIAHYLWKKRKPNAYSASDSHYKKCFKR